MRSKFDAQLVGLHRQLISMGSLCENAIAMAAKSLLDGDVALAKKVQSLSEQIDQKEREIEALCLKLLLQQQPVAKDLRLISSALKMITDMERIGDQAADIAEIVTMDKIQGSGDMKHIRAMAEATIQMVTQSIDAFVGSDRNMANNVIAYDDVVDDYFDQIKKSLIIHFAQMGDEGEYALDLLMVAKYFERIGDHAVNIAQWVVFSITGSHDNT